MAIVVWLPHRLLREALLLVGVQTALPVYLLVKLILNRGFGRTCRPVLRMEVFWVDRRPR